MTTTYRPINCEFHDVLEATATSQRRVTIVYVDAAGEECTALARITDLRAKVGAVYMPLDVGSVVRRAAIGSGDGVRLAAF